MIRCFLILIFSSAYLLLSAQEEGSKIDITGNVKDAVSGVPISQVLISVSGTSVSAISNDSGTFKIKDVEGDAILRARHPDFTSREFYLHNQKLIEIILIPIEYKSNDDIVVTPYNDQIVRNVPTSFDYLSKGDLKNSAETSFERCIQGQVSGLRVSTLSGMPGSLSVLSLRGLSTLSGKNDPVIIIDGVLHETHYPIESSITGFVHNPLEMVDVDDIQSITVIKDAQGFLGSMGANGAIVINTEERKETSSAIRLQMYQGIVTPAKKLKLMNADQYNSYFSEQLSTSGLSQAEINEKFPWRISGNDPEYTNNTDWQQEITSPGWISKYHLFVKGGDNIGNINMSTGFLRHTGILDNTNYSRFNLRINSKINITNKFSFNPNVKLSTSNSSLMEQGPSDVTNPILAANLKPPITRPYSIEGNSEAEYINDVDAFPVSNPVAIVNFLGAQNKNYQLIVAGKAKYEFNKKLYASTLTNLSYNNSRDRIFIPDKGLLEIDSARNSMRSMVTEFRSLQNNFLLNYNTQLNSKSSLNLRVGNRILSSRYEYDLGTDLNSATDDFRSLGSGSEDQFLRVSVGDYRTLNIVSYYTIADYQYSDKYYLNVSLSVDGNSIVNKKERYNFYYSVAGAMNLLSGKPALASRYDELKLRTSIGRTGNVFNNVYDYSRLYYIGRRINDIGVIIRESIPNENMEIEKKTMVNLGLDLSTSGQKLSTNIDVYYERVGNLIVPQKISSAYGYPYIYNNAGVLSSVGAEIAADYQFNWGTSFWTLGLTTSSSINRISKIDQNLAEGDDDYILTPIEDTQNSGATLITKPGEAPYSFYGYETNGIFTNENEANNYVGPKGNIMHAGDVKFVDQDHNGIIDENDKKVLGNPDPLIFGGLFVSFTKGRISATANFSYSVGNKIYNYMGMRTNSADNFFNQSSEVADRWTSTNTGSDIPRAAYGDPSGNNVFSDRWVEDGSYLRLKNITVSYKLPTTNNFFKYLEMYFTATNLVTITGYSGYDPEFLYANELKYNGVDFGKMPFGRSFIIGINLGL